jgi:hypothetical protein
MPIYVDCLIITKCLSTPWGVKFKYTRKLTNEVLGLITALTAGICSFHQNITASTTSTSRQLKLNDSGMSISATKNITSPSLSPQDKLMKALADCKAALSGTRTSPTELKTQELQRLVDLAHIKLD